MILTDLTAVQKTIERFLDANRDYVLKTTKSGRMILEITQRFVDGKYQEKDSDEGSVVKLKRIPVNVQSIIRQKHS